MSNPNDELGAYLRRIGHAGPVAADLATLQALQALHVAAIPFENLSPLLGEEVGLDASALGAKLVAGGRGGYCYEHNLLLLSALNAIGFDARGLAARVRWNVADDIITPRTHMLLLVRIEGVDWIADAGFGGLTLSAPLRLLAEAEQPTPHETCRLLPQDGAWLLQARLGDAWKTLYAFDLQQQQRPDYELASWYLSHHPRSLFTTRLMAARAEPGRRHALLNNRYTVHHTGGGSQTTVLANAAELMQSLERDFMIRLPAHPQLKARLQRLIEDESLR
jgi:N-hydroxyarylamine O-acetyltransferase